MWILVAVEHGIVVVKQLCAALIADVPGWVAKSQQRVEREERQLALQQQLRDRKDMVDLVRKKMEAQVEQRRRQMDALEQVVKAHERQNKELKEQIGREKVAKAEAQAAGEKAKAEAE